ncbi:cytochrome c oxidase accessory protein CcoG [Runella rosea]|uniref:Cytochrome c oxidase accessory protein CcoG n=1 Tax=Runella rosea TaxID=2259595 RepID=A0A344TRK0_9BACT|nr:cytochrome c oxidase accessory protein CcoG [Runella rosea]AXE21271.1 cytochrome c oxidase accessory protein CcoG [Runella rosea]
MNPLDTHPDFDESFRDNFAAVDNTTGKRNWFFPQKPTGKWHNRRVWFTIFQLSVMFGLPFIKVNGQPLFLFNILERKFIIFGLFIGPQDYWLFGLMMISFFVFIVLFTTVFGRVWCGWACPQTVFMEMVFRKIEYVIEGDWKAQRALEKAPWNNEKIVKRTLKVVVFMTVSFLIANLLLSYFVGVDRLWRIVSEPITEHLTLFLGICAFTLIFFFNFAWLRDQACTVVCPYGRLQGVLLDKNSVVIAYDYKRGEPREKLHKGKERTAGDCINCFQCVNVCPTGIDIRNGTQMECVNCTACIDACDNIMEKVNLPKGLIRFDSENNIASGKSKLITTRTIAYAVVLTALWVALGYAILTRDDTETTMLRVPGSRYIENPDGSISNLYTFKLFNKTNHAIDPQMRILFPKGTLKFAGIPSLHLDGAGMVEGSVFITIPKTEIANRRTEIKLAIYAGSEKLEEFKTTFIAPEE